MAGNEASRVSGSSRTAGTAPALDTWNIAAERHALTLLFRNEFSSVYSFVLARCGSAGIAEEVASETFADAARAARDGRGRELSKSWLLMVARRRLIDIWRSDERHRRRINRIRLERTQPVHDLTLTSGEEHDDNVLRALESLPTRQRAALTLRYLDELSVDEVAEVLEVSYRAAESLLSRARAGFKAAYEEQ